MCAILLGYPLLLLPAQIIWLNFVTDPFLGSALAMEPKEKGLLKGKFKRPSRYLVDKIMVQRMILMAITMMIGTIFIFRNYFENDISKAWTMSLTVLAVFQWFNAWNCRHESISIFKMNPLSNKFLLGGTIIIFLLQLLVVYNPLMQKIFRTSPLDISEWILIIFVASFIIFVDEIRKFLYQKFIR
jgi:Ca2+-transporting ATPase